MAKSDRRKVSIQYHEQKIKLLDELYKIIKREKKYTKVLMREMDLPERFVNTLRIPGKGVNIAHVFRIADHLGYEMKFRFVRKAYSTYNRPIKVDYGKPSEISDIV